MLDKSNCWIETFTGKKFHVLDAQLEEIDIRDIAHALSLQCRFTGHTKRFYSVAEHSMFVSLISPTAPLWGLLHDASEAYIADMSRPLKYFSSVGEHYMNVEKKLMEVILHKFKLQGPMPKEVHEADQTMLLTEREQLMSGVPWDGLYGEEVPKRIELYCYPPEVVEKHFLERFEYLSQGENQ